MCERGDRQDQIPLGRLVRTAGDFTIIDAQAGHFTRSVSVRTVPFKVFANNAVRSSRGVLGQMVLILLTPVIRDTPFRGHYERLTARERRPAMAIGHVTAKLAAVLNSMLKP